MKWTYLLIGLLLVSIFLAGCRSNDTTDDVAKDLGMNDGSNHATDDVAKDLGMDNGNDDLVDLPALDEPTQDIDVGFVDPDTKLIELGELV